MHQLLTGISLSIRIHTRESSLCCIIRVQQKPLPNRTVLFSKVLLYRISSSLWPLVKQGNKLGEGRQVKYGRPKLQMTGFFWRICTYTWFGLKASFLGRRQEQRKFFAFRFIWPPRSAWPKELVKLRQLRPYIQLSSPSGANSRSIARGSLQVRWEAWYRLYWLRTHWICISTHQAKDFHKQEKRLLI